MTHEYAPPTLSEKIGSLVELASQYEDARVPEQGDLVAFRKGNMYQLDSSMPWIVLEVVPPGALVAQDRANIRVATFCGAPGCVVPHMMWVEHWCMESYVMPADERGRAN